jgi:hypothetical protein
MLSKAVAWLLSVLIGLAVVGALLWLVPAWLSDPVASPVHELKPATGSFVTVTYASSVDGVALRFIEYLPSGYVSTTAYPLAILLHGAGGNINQYNTPEWRNAADAHGYILALIEARTLISLGYPASRLTFFLDGVLPSAQDVLDVIPVMQSRRLINPSRIYIGGYSMGGIGAMNIATQNPGVFAAAAPGVIISDLFQAVAYTTSQPIPSFATLLGGAAGASPITDTSWYQNSPRFLLPNLMHTPLTIVHGLSDALVPNAVSIWPYMQSRHIVDTPGFADTRGRATTLQELRAQWPSSYEVVYSWPPVNHGAGGLYWITDSVLSFFDAHFLVTNPLTVAFTTYEDKHTRAYWLQLNLTQPWTAQPALVYAIRYPSQNAAQLLVTGSMTLTLDMPMMELTSTKPLTLVVQPVNGVVPAGAVAVVWSGTWSTNSSYTITKDGAPLSPLSFTVALTHFTLLRQTTDFTHTYVIAPTSNTPTAPSITSALFASGLVGLPFSYTITASGTPPITFTASALPSGLTLNGAVIRGTPTLTGTTPVVITATNAMSVDVQTLLITINAVNAKVYLPLVVR